MLFAQQRTLTTFLIDISETMGRERVVKDAVEAERGGTEKKQRTISHLQWCLEFVTRKTIGIVRTSATQDLQGLILPTFLLCPGFASDRSHSADLLEAQNGADDAHYIRFTTHF